MVVFLIMGKTEPIYEADIGSSADDLAYLHQFILHASLDMLQNAIWTNPSVYLKTIDRFNSLQVSAYVTLGGTAMLLLHSGRATEETIRCFFAEAHEAYVRHLMNPFSSPDLPIITPQFDLQIRSAAKKHLQIA
jgi:hypothetical protein